MGFCGRLVALVALLWPATAVAGIVPAHRPVERSVLGSRADTHGAFRSSPGRLRVASRPGRRAFWLARAPELRDGLVRMRVETHKKADVVLMVRATGPAGAIDGWGVRLQRYRASIVRIRKGRLVTVARQKAPIRYRKTIEVVAQLVGGQLVAQVHDARSGRHLASLSADIGPGAGRIGVAIGKRHDPDHAVELLTARAACADPPPLSGPLGPRRFVHVPTAVRDALPSALKSRLTFLERKGRGDDAVAVYETDAIGVEHLACADALATVSLETPWKYLDPEYRKRRHLRPKATKTGFVVDGSYKSPRMVGRLLKAYAKRFPELTHLERIGRSREGRPIWALAVGRHLRDGQSRPAVFLNGSHHGNEPLSTEFVFDALQQLLERSDDPAVARWLESFTFWTVPLVNPDGAWAFLEHTIMTGRKNGRDNDRNGRRDVLDGVDLNRNYPFRWGALGEKGSRSDPESAYYRGEKPASEPEVRAVMRLAERERFALSLTYHVGTVAILAPYTIDEVDNPAPNEAWTVAEQIAAKLPEHPQDRRYEVRKNLYSVDGTDQDWLRHSYGTLALLVEGARNSPKDPDLRKRIVEVSRPIWQLLLDRYLDGPSLAVVVRDRAGEPVEASVTVVEMPTRAGERWRTRPRDGRFDRVVTAPGRYTLRIEVPGVPVHTRTVEVVRGAPTRVDVTLPFDQHPPAQAQ